MLLNRPDTHSHGASTSPCNTCSLDPPNVAFLTASVQLFSHSSRHRVPIFTPPYSSMEGYLVYCVVFLCLFFVFFCTITDFSAADRNRGVKFCMCVGLLSGQVFSPFGEVWLVGSRSRGWWHYFLRESPYMKHYSVDRCAFLGTNIEDSSDGR